VSAADLPVDELACGLPLFGVRLQVPGLGAELQVFRIARTVPAPAVSLHTLLVHPEQLEALAPLRGVDVFVQSHGELWPVRGTAGGVEIGRLGGPAEYVIRRDGDRVVAADRAGRVLATTAAGRFAADDPAKVELIGACFLDAYEDETLSLPLVRGYPGLTSLIRRYRSFVAVLADEPGPATAPSRWLWDGVVPAAEPVGSRR
jgi:hypothetical protein